MNIFRRFVVVMVLFAIVSVSSLFAFQFSPLTQTFSPTGAESTKTYTIVNDSDDAIAVQISALIRDMDENGAEVNSDGSAYFNIQPSRAVIRPQSSIIVRVIYRGPKTVAKELPFRIKAEQIEYSQGKASSSQSMFNFLYVYNSSAYVTPTNTQARVSVSSIKDNGDGKLAVTVVNQGNVHQLLSDATLSIQDAKGNSVKLTGDEALPGISGINLLAGKTVTKLIDKPEALAANSTYRGTLGYNN